MLRFQSTLNCSMKSSICGCKVSIVTIRSCRLTCYNHILTASNSAELWPYPVSFGRINNQEQFLKNEKKTSTLTRLLVKSFDGFGRIFLSYWNDRPTSSGSLPCASITIRDQNRKNTFLKTTGIRILHQDPVLI